MQEHQNSRRPIAVLITVAMVIVGLTALGSPAYAADVGYKGPYYGQAPGTTGVGSVPGAPTAQKPQSKLWFAQGSWWGALWNDTPTNTGEAFTIQRYDWAANQWIDTGVKLETRARSDLDVLWDGNKLYVASNTDAATIAEQSIEVSRFSYSGGTWALEWTALVASAYAYAPVIEKDSTGMLWMTYTQGTKVMVTHSQPGNQQSWEPPYPLPTPNGESTVSYDSSGDPNQASSDIASIVAFDGDKVGILWSNQATDTVYWASHADGTSDRQWATGVAFTAPEGADDHISLKSVTGTAGGRVYAVTKTSMNGAEPIFEVLVMRLDGTWDSYPYASADTNLTRPIILLHPAKQELYVFAAAGESANSGGSIYYKKTSMTSPDFGSMSNRGTLFIADSALTADANTERINNPSSTKQNLNATTGLLVIANNDPTDYYYYNRMSLTDPPPDTTAPNTVIEAGPTGSVKDTAATFSFSSNEAGSTFECRLDSPDPSPWQPCASPQAYTVGEGSHTFEVRARDAAGNTDLTPAARTWTVTDTTAPDTVIDSGPTGSVQDTSATFSFSSTETGSTFECRLDAAAWASCSSPKSYTGLTAKEYTFEVRAKDAAGNADVTPATRTWTVLATSTGGTGGGGGGGSTPPPDDGGSTPPPDDGGSTPPPSTPERDDAILFADDFSTGFADGWSSFTKADGTVTVQAGAIEDGDNGARLRTSNDKGSTAVLSKGLARGRALEIRWSALVTRDAATGTSSLIRVRDTSGRVVLTVLRRAATNRLVVRDLSGTTTRLSKMPNGSVSSLTLVLRQRTGRDAWSLSVNGRTVSTSAARTGGRALLAVAFGTNGGNRLDYRLDDVTVMRP